MSGTLNVIEEKITDEIFSEQYSGFFEEAEAIAKLIECHGMTQEDAAAKLGKAQSTIANKLRLLRLSEDERELITKFHLTERHARALLKLGSQEERMCVLEKVIKNNLNVDKTEKLVDDYIGFVRVKNNYKKRGGIFGGMKSFAEVLNKAVSAMQAAGISACSSRIQNDDYIEYRVRIPRR